MDKTQEKELVTRIMSKTSIAIDEAIKLIREEGGLKALEALIEIYSAVSDSDKEKISLLFNDLRDEKCIPLMLQHIETTEDLVVKKMLLTACWQNRLDFSQELEAFILIVLKETFEFSFEAFTVIENMESKLSSDRKAELIKFAEEHIDESSEGNLTLAQDLVSIIQNYEEM